MRAVFFKFLILPFCAAALLATGGCVSDVETKMQDVERINEMTDEEIKAAREACHIISTADCNCADLVKPTPGMSTEEWETLHKQTKICRKNQLLSFNHCLRGKGVRYAN